MTESTLTERSSALRKTLNKQYRKAASHITHSRRAMSMTVPTTEV